MPNARKSASQQQLAVAPPDRNSFRARSLALELRDPARAPVSSAVFHTKGFSAQYVVVPRGAEYGFEWVGKTHFLAFHDLRMRDGETFADDLPATRMRDARQTFTFIPSGCRVWGWTAPTLDHNSFVALYLDPDQLQTEMGARLSGDILQPQVFFKSPLLTSTISKLQRALDTEDRVDRLYLDSLCALTAIEFCRSRETSLSSQSLTARVGSCSIARIDDFIQDSLGSDISLEQLAELSGLSRFHFVRAFKRTTGETPYQRVLRKRIEAAQELLTLGKLTVNEVATRVGFRQPSRFIQTFRAATGLTPGEYSRAASTRGRRPRGRR